MQISSTTGGRAAGSASASEPGDASSGSRGSASASQPGQTTRKLTPTVLLRLGSFNFGVEQNQLQSGKPKELGRLLHALGGKVARCVLDANLDFLFGCEVGGHRAGLPAAGLEYRNVLLDAFGTDVQAEALQNYTAAWNLGRRVSESFVLRKNKSEVVKLQSSLFTAQCHALDPQLAMWCFQVVDHSQARFGFLIVGDLHVTSLCSIFGFQNLVFSYYFLAVSAFASASCCRFGSRPLNAHKILCSSGPDII